MGWQEQLCVALSTGQLQAACQQRQPCLVCPAQISLPGARPHLLLLLSQPQRCVLRPRTRAPQPMRDVMVGKK